MAQTIWNWFTGREKLYLVFLIFMLHQIFINKTASYLSIYVVLFGIYTYYLVRNVYANRENTQTVHIVDKYIKKGYKDATKLMKNDSHLSHWLGNFRMLRFIDPNANDVIVRQITRFYALYASSLRHARDPQSVLHTLIAKRHYIINLLHRFYMQVQESHTKEHTQFSSNAILLLSSMGKCLDAITLKYGLPDSRHVQAANVYGDEHDIY